MKLTQEQIEKIRNRAKIGPFVDDSGEMVFDSYDDIPKLIAHIKRLDNYIVFLGEQVESDKEVKFGYYNENKMLRQQVEAYVSVLNEIANVEPDSYYGAVQLARNVLEGDANAES